MIRPAIITGLAIVIFAGSEARAGLMTPDALLGDAATSAGAASGSAPAGYDEHDGRLPGQEQLDRLTSQPAQGGTGAGGSSTFSTYGFSTAAMVPLVSLTDAATPSGYCVEQANSQLPQPPTSDLLRPPQHIA